MTKKRAAGILIHLTSLPGPHGIGDIKSGIEFIDFLSEAGQSHWQFLPTTPGTDFFDYSPYMAMSALAGNPLLISPDLLISDGLIGEKDIPADPGFLDYRVKYSLVTSYKDKILRKAFASFKSEKKLQADFDEFCKRHTWLDDYGLFQALKKKYEKKPWFEWPEELAHYNQEALQKASDELSEEVKFHKFLQFLFFRQWKWLKEKAEVKGVSLIGDIPIYISLDSVDVWANQSCFDLDKKTLKPRHVAGVPPDYFSKTGQLWGNPLYLWGTENEPNKDLDNWWSLRFKTMSEWLDMIRIDHFSGFASYWEVPGDEKTAENGRWKSGPGASFFDERISDSIKDLDIIAEDLGMYIEDVSKLRDKLDYPGMKVLQFAFDSDPYNLHLPHNYGHDNWVVYTGTHDNDTTIGWYLDPGVSENSKQKARRYCNSDGSSFNKDFIKLAYSSTAWLAVIPIQDVFGLGNDCRMNLPGSEKGNWRWRCPAHFFSNENSKYLREETWFYARLNK